jgi:hypothetical protein
MAAGPRSENLRPRAYISLAEIPTALRKLTRRLDELRNLEGPKPDTDFVGLSRLIADRINTTIEEVFGDDTAEARRFQVDRLSFLTNVPSKRVEEFCRGRDRAIAVIEAAIEWLAKRGTAASRNRRLSASSKGRRVARLAREREDPMDQLRLVIDTIPTLVWSCRPDGAFAQQIPC